MFRMPSRRRNSKTEVEKLNLIPILDSVFIFIFFLLMSANFIKIFEINSDLPIVASTPPKDEKKPLALTIKIDDTKISIATGVPSTIQISFPKNSEGEYDLPKLHEYLIELKRRNIEERSVIFEPLIDLSYEEIVKIMDAVRTLRNTDESFYRKNKDGVEEKVKELFDQIVFGNLLS